MRLAAAAPLALALGCVAVHHPAPLPEPADADATRARLSGWVVGVREPEIRYREPDAPVPDMMDEVRDAGRLVVLLRDTGLFSRVDFTKQLDCPPDLELAVRAHAGERLDGNPIWVLTLSIVIHEEKGVAFSLPEGSEETFELAHPTTFALGLVPLVASPVVVTGWVPGWSIFGEPAIEEQLEAYLLENVDRLEATRDPEAPACVPPPEEQGSAGGADAPPRG